MVLVGPKAGISVVTNIKSYTVSTTFKSLSRNECRCLTSDFSKHRTLLVKKRPNKQYVGFIEISSVELNVALPDKQFKIVIIFDFPLLNLLLMNFRRLQQT